LSPVELFTPWGDSPVIAHFASVCAIISTLGVLGSEKVPALEAVPVLVSRKVSC
jgi:hypothetical protein